MFSIVRSDDSVILSINIENILRMVKQISKHEIDKNDIIRAVTPKNLDIISFVNDLAVKSKVGNKYMILSDVDSYHPGDYIYHQCRYDNNICNIVIKDMYDGILMGEGSEDCPGTKKIVNYYKSSYETSQLKVLNKNSMFIRGGGGIYAVIERNVAEFVTYLSWVKLNEVFRLVKAKYPESNIDLASSFEVIERTDGIMYDIVRKLKENKDSSFFMLDGISGNRIKMSVDTNTVSNVESDLTADYYHQEFVNNMASYRAGTVDSITSAIKSADSRIKKSMSVGIRTGLQLANTLIKQGWKIEVVGGIDCFVYPNKVYVTTVFDGSKRYTFPEDCQDLLYLYDITVPIDSQLHGLDSRTMGVKARGFHPHRSSGSSNYYNDLEHITELNVVCIGDLDNKPIEKIVNLIDALSGAYKPSMMGNAASRCVTCLYGSDYGVMSTDTTPTEVKKLLAYIDPFVQNKGVLSGKVTPKMEAIKKKKGDSTAGEPAMVPIRSGSVFQVT